MLVRGGVGDVRLVDGAPNVLGLLEGEHLHGNVVGAGSVPRAYHAAQQRVPDETGGSFEPVLGLPALVHLGVSGAVASGESIHEQSEEDAHLLLAEVGSAVEAEHHAAGAREAVVGELAKVLAGRRGHEARSDGSAVRGA